MDKMGKSVTIAIVSIQTSTVCPDPQIAARVLEETIDVIVRNGERVTDIVAIDLKRVAVKPVQAILRPQPQEALMILDDATNLRLGQTLIDGIPTEPDLVGWDKGIRRG